MINLDLIYPEHVDDYVILEMQGQLENPNDNESLNAFPLGELQKIDEK